MDLVTLLTILGLFLAICGLTIAAFMHLVGKIDSLENLVYHEMRDFHGRLCSIEERNITKEEKK